MNFINKPNIQYIILLNHIFYKHVELNKVVLVKFLSFYHTLSYLEELNILQLFVNGFLHE